MRYSHVLFETDEAGVALVTVNRPDRRNALSAEVIAELGVIFDEIARDSRIRGVILTGAGDRAFVAGADISELAGLSPMAARDYSEFGQKVFGQIEKLRKPVVAAVNGYALGGGMELAMACSLRFAAETAQFGQPEVKIGWIPGFGATQRLPRLVGRGRALELLLSGDVISAAEAHRIGLVNAVAPLGMLLDFSRAWLMKALANAPVALELALRAVDVGLEGEARTGMSFESAAFGLCAATEDCREGARAFLEKRRPVFAGK